MATHTELPRLPVLAQPKRLPPAYRDDRRSVYWVEREPLRGGPDGHTVFIATPRVVQLARHKTCVGAWQPHRPSPIWPVSDGAMTASSTARLAQLSEHRMPHRSYTFDCDPQWEISDASKKASASARIDALAVPKKREEVHPSLDPYWGYRYPVSEAAMRTNPTERLDALAMHKTYHKDFQDARQVQWDVSQQALEALASLRLQQLARPRSRTMIKDDYDPYKIAPSAKKTRATPRVEELALPIPRKVRQKKMAAA
ncbi:hypothetical protein RRG08_053776 [Elysia crispata]|uniref:Testicular haploid expressed gene protein n=1 Tax=Elysia crispata TaxID=231223 RepID=A0AAE0YVZ7_9GAST|nr:hypothetical protein RRG08_053776 [Elysia crispata]